MGKCIEKIKHSCGSYSLQVFLEDNGKYTGWCFKCGKFEDNPYGDQPEGYKPKVVLKSPEQIQKEIEEISSYKTHDIPHRKLKKEALEYFGVKVGVSEQDGTTPQTMNFPYYVGKDLIGYKVKLLDPKRMWAVGTTKGADFFGWDKAIGTGAKRLFITEGEPDAIALYQIFKDQNKNTQYADLNPAIVSLVNGAGSAKRDIPNNLKKIKEYFKEIVLVFDTDEAGSNAAEDVARLIPDVKIAKVPSKDINDALIEGRSKAVYSACQFNAQAPKNTRLVTGESLHESAKEPPKYGLSWPWSHITKATRGIRFGETIYLGAGQKQGKSEVVNTLAAHFIVEHGLKVFLVKPEESNKKTYKLVAGKIEGKVFHDPEVAFDEEAYEKAGKKIKGNLFMLNLYQHVGWESLKNDIRHAAAVEGCKVVMIDPITNLTNGMDAAAANVKLQEIAQELSSMALDLDIVIFIFCHLRNPDAGPPHERGGEVLSSQFAGSRAMARSCNLMLGLEGNRDPSLSSEERNIRTLVLLEDREYGEVGRFKMYWDKATQLFMEIN
jgi:twinkle protein